MLGNAMRRLALIVDGSAMKTGSLPLSLKLPHGISLFTLLCFFTGHVLATLALSLSGIDCIPSIVTNWKHKLVL